LKNKNKKFIYTKKCEEEFQKLKVLLMMFPILKVPNMDQDFLVCTYASKEGLGKVIM
jgi:hypothetical protein